jgi:hypothetical protein
VEIARLANFGVPPPPLDRERLQAAHQICYAKLASPQGDEEDTRNAKATDAIQVEQTHTAPFGAGPNDYIRFRAGYAAS